MFTTDLLGSAYAEARVLHARDAQCSNPASDALFFSIFRKTGGRPSQRSYRMPRLEAVVSATAGQDDTYMSQSSFFASSRKAVNFEQTRAAWVDLDLYNIDRVADSAMVAQILQHGESLGIPAPTAVIFSGRGCYLKWIFEVPVTRLQLPVWQLLQATLTAAYSSLAADFKARDASRVFRLLQTRNSKSGALVSVLDGSGQLYDFAALCQCVESLRADLLIEQTQASVASTAGKKGIIVRALTDSAQRGDAQALEIYSELRRPIMLRSMSEQSLNWARFCDLRDLFVARGGIAVGERDNALFWMLNFLSQAQVIRSCDWEDEIAQLMRAFPDHRTFEPLRDGSMNSLLQRLKDKECGKKYTWRGVEITPMYRPTNEFLIQAFGIKPQEMTGLSTLICPLEKRHRVDAKVPGRAEKRQERDRWREEVREAFESTEKNAQQELASGQGDPAKAINLAALARFVGAERTRVSRYWSKLGSQRQSADAAPKARRQSCTEHKAPAPSLPAQPHGFAEPGVPLPSHAAALLALQASQQARLAQDLARQAQEAAQALTLQRQLERARERWVTRKITDLITPTAQAMQPEFVSPELTMTVQPPSQSEPARSSLDRKMALLNAAQGQAPAPGALATGPAQGRAANPGAHAPAEVPAHLLDSDPNDNWHEAGHSAGITGEPLAWVYKEPPPAPLAGRQASDSSASAPRPSLQERLRQASPPSRSAAPAHTAPPGTKNAPPAGVRPAPVPQSPPAAARPSLQERLAAHTSAQASLPRSVSARPAPVPLRPACAAPHPVKADAQAVLPGGTVPAPAGYPDPEHWPSNTIPPGSKYTQQAWDAARTDAHGNHYDVLEMQSPYSAWLVQLIKPVQATRRMVENGSVKIVSEHVYPKGVPIPALCGMVAQMFSDCIWVSQKATPTFPDALEGMCELAGANYRVIRPRNDYLLPELAFRVGAKLVIPPGFSANPNPVADEDDPGGEDDMPAGPSP